MPEIGKNCASHSGRLTGQNALVSKVFCQESLTKSAFWVENREDNSSPNFMGKFGRLAGAIALTGALGAAEAAAGDKPINSAETPIPVTATVDGTGAQITDCVAYVKAERAAQKAKGIAMSRRDQKTLLRQCGRGELQALLVEQQAILAALRDNIAATQLRIDDKEQVIDEQGRVLAQIVTINGQLVLQRQQQKEETADMDAANEALLDEAQKIIDQLASS